MFSTAGTSAVTGIARLQLRDGAHRAEHCRAARHVVLHLLHALGRLDGDAAGVEGDAFADQPQMIGRLRRRLPGVYRTMISAGGSALPCATPSSDPMPSCRMRS